MNKQTILSSQKRTNYVFAICITFLLLSTQGNAQNSNANTSATGANWKSNGNAATTSDFIGTTNAQDLIFKTNNTERLILDRGGNLILKERIPGHTGELHISPGLIQRSIPTNPIAAYMLKVGGSGFFEGELNTRQLFVQEYITYMKSLKGPSINVDSIKMDSTRGIFGHTKIFGDVNIKQSLLVEGAATFKNTLTAEKGLMLNNQIGMKLFTDRNNNPVIGFGGITGPIDLDPVSGCLVPTQSPWFYFGGKIQLHDAASNTSLTLGSDGYQSIIESEGSNSLLLNYYCGKDVAICTNENTPYSSNGKGGVVRMGHNVMIGGPWPADNYAVALNINAPEQTGLFVKSTSTTNPYNYGVVSSVDGLNNKAFAVLLQNANNDKEVISLRGNGEAYFGTLSATVKPTLYVSPSVDPGNQYITGRVGIGTNAPATALDVKGDITVSNLSNATNTTRALLVDATGKLIPGAASTQSTVNWALGGNQINNPATEYFGSSNVSDLYINTANTPRIIVKADGKIGFGDITNSSANFAFAKNNADCNVSISTNNGTKIPKFSLGNSVHTADIYLGSNAAGPSPFVMDWNGKHFLSFNNGNMLIGDPDNLPGDAASGSDMYTKLTISAKTSGGANSWNVVPLRIVNPDLTITNKVIFEVKGDGNAFVKGKLGVGTNNPAVALDVIGDINASKSSAPASITVGAGGLNGTAANKSKLTLSNTYGFVDIAQDENGIGSVKWANANVLSFHGDNILIGEPPVGPAYIGEAYTKLTISSRASDGSTFTPLKITNPNLTSTNKTVFEVGADGKTVISTNAATAFEVYDSYSAKTNFSIKTNGFVYARRVEVTMNNFPDYVFSSMYKKVPLNELGSYLEMNKHLPNMPVASEIEKNGADLGELQRLTIEKTEEAFIYISELQKQIELLKKENELIKEQLNKLNK